MWNEAFIHWIRQRSQPLIRLPGNADNGNGLYWGMKLDERKFQLLSLREDSAFGAIRGGAVRALRMRPTTLVLGLTRRCGRPAAWTFGIIVRVRSVPGG